jgi:hypothetical protein
MGIWGALLLGSLALGIISGLGVWEIAAITWTALTTPLTLQLTLIIILIGVLGKIMKDVGMLERMVVSLFQLITNHFKLLAKTFGPIMTLIISTIVLYWFLL